MAAELAGRGFLRRPSSASRAPTNNPQVTDEGLAHLTGLPQLKGLQLIGTKVTDQGLAYLDGLPQLTGLLLDGTQVTDAGLAISLARTKLFFAKLYL